METYRIIGILGVILLMATTIPALYLSHLRRKEIEMLQRIRMIRMIQTVCEKVGVDVSQILKMPLDL